MVTSPMQLSFPGNSSDLTDYVEATKVSIIYSSILNTYPITSFQCLNLN